MTTASQRSWYKRNEIAVTPWLFLLPGIIMFALYVIIPIFQSFWISFHQWDGLGEKTWVGMANYERLLGGDRKFETSFWNNLRWLILYLLAIPMGLFISLFLNQKVFGFHGSTFPTTGFLTLSLGSLVSMFVVVFSAIQIRRPTASSPRACGRRLLIA